MASQTTNIGLTKQANDEYQDNDIQNSNLDILDTEIGKRGKTVNGIAPDDTGNYQLNEVPFARQIVTDDLLPSSDEYLIRTTGGSASIGTGSAKLVSILGRSSHTGIVEESISMTVNSVTREDPSDTGITATIDRDTFVAYVEDSGTIELEYTDAWSANPSLYGVTVTGTPEEGDTIVIVYVKADRGTITNSNPTKFISTGWNLYNHTLGYARVLKYSTNYGFMIGGTYTAVKFSATLTGTQTTITPVSGKFTIPSDGYVWVTGGNNTNTYIIMTWSDWTSGYSGTFAAYTESTINLATIMTNFPYGLMQVGGTTDEIDLSTGIATSRIERLSYSAENLATAQASGRAWDADENYIYLVRATAVTYSTSVSGDYAADDHGMEIITDSTVPVFVQTLYGANLVDKLRTDVVTKSSDLVNNASQTASGKALDARMGKTLKDAIDAARLQILAGTAATKINANSNFNDITTPGIYYVNSDADAATMSNIPRSASGKLAVISNTGSATNYETQIYFPTTSVTLIYFRTKSGNSWTAWDRPVMYNKSGIGTLDTGTMVTNVTVPNNTVTLLTTLELSSGSWIIVAGADWECTGNNTGYRQLSFTEPINPGRYMATTTLAPGDSSKETYQQVVRLLHTSGETISLYGLQTNGSSIKAFPFIHAMKIADI